MRTVHFILILFLGYLNIAQAQKNTEHKKNTAFFSGELLIPEGFAFLYDTAVIEISTRFLGVNDKRINPTTFTYKAKIQDNRFTFLRLKLDSISVIALSLKGSSMADNEVLLFQRKFYYASPDDSIDMKFQFQRTKRDGSRLEVKERLFSGRGSAKFIVQNQIENKIEDLKSIFYKRESLEGRPNYDDSTYWLKKVKHQENNFSLFESIHSECVKLLDSTKRFLSIREYNILKSDCISRCNLEKINAFIGNYKRFPPNVLSEGGLKRIQAQILNHYINEKVHTLENIPFADQEISMYNIDFKSVQAAFLPWTNGEDGFRMLTQQKRNSLSDKILTHYVLQYFRDLKNGDSLLRRSVQVVKDDLWSSMLTEYANSIMAGSMAFNFELENSEGKMASLSDFKGKLVVIDFWYTGCGACRLFYQNSLSVVEDIYKDNPKVVFVTISTDIIRNEWLNSLNTQTYTSTKKKNVYSFFTNGMGKNHPVISNFKVTSYPRPIIIDPDGRIYKADRLQIPHQELTEIINHAINKYRLSN